MCVCLCVCRGERRVAELSGCVHAFESVYGRVCVWGLCTLPQVSHYILADPSSAPLAGLRFCIGKRVPDRNVGLTEWSDRRYESEWVFRLRPRWFSSL